MYYFRREIVTATGCSAGQRNQDQQLTPVRYHSRAQGGGVVLQQFKGRKKHIFLLNNLLLLQRCSSTGTKLLGCRKTIAILSSSQT